MAQSWLNQLNGPLLRSIEVNWGRNKWVYVNVWRYLTWNVSKVKLSTVTRRREKRFTFYCVFFKTSATFLPKNRNNVKNRSNPTTLERLRAAEFGTTIGLPKNGAAAGRERVRRCSEERVATRETKVVQHWNRDCQHWSHRQQKTWNNSWQSWNHPNGSLNVEPRPGTTLVSPPAKVWVCSCSGKREFRRDSPSKKKCVAKKLVLEN